MYWKNYFERLNETNWDAGQRDNIKLGFLKKILSTKFSWNVQILARWKYKKFVFTN